MADAQKKHHGVLIGIWEWGARATILLRLLLWLWEINVLLCSRILYIYIDSVHTCRVYLSGRLTSQFALESNHMPFTVSDLAVPYRLHCTWSSLKHPWPIPPFHKHLPWLPRTLCIPFKLFDQIKVPSTSWTQILEEPTLVSRSTSMKSKVLVFALTLRKSSMFSLGRVRRRSWMTASVKSCTRRQALRKRRPSGVR